MNDTLKTIAERYSCRSFAPDMPTDAELATIANAAVQSPSAVNRQGWRIIVVKDKSILADMETTAMAALKAMEDQSLCQRFMDRGGTIYYRAPVMFVIAVDENRDLLDCGIVAENITLAATSLGLGSVICGMAAVAFTPEKKDEFEKRMGFPPGYSLGMAVLVGRPDKAPNPPHQPDQSKISYVG